MYSITLFSLLTSLQLTLLARSKYIHSVLEDERQERLSEKLQSQYSWDNILLGFWRGRGGSTGSNLFGLGKGTSGTVNWEELLANTDKMGGEPDFLGGGGSGSDVPKMREWEEEWYSKIEKELRDDTQEKYLAMTWWILHVGWKDLQERVRKGVEEVFEGCVLGVR